MVNVYTSLIIKGKRTLDSVPEKIREQVKAELIERGYEELAK